ncbi:BT1926 family outer membrane beta-barrel protein [Lutibacter sp.]|uniref:BT1926 family outer membrane beta-barrel protein n=1 Tax=Lutibacter sp. TaxID=1925666 RepID=UPI0025BB98C9|nr:BT1926 family outer membrane beta-barrel protein [Lutibacter sp.]MCF6168133.1 outer membrane beta-barrel protein [Lutibacter sp.]
MKKYLILCFILVISLTSANAQDKDSDHVCKTDTCCVDTPKFAPQKGDFTAAMVFGRGAYLNGGLVVPSTYGSVSGAAPYANDVDANSNDITNMVGAEGRYYIKNNFAVTLSGGAILRNTPYQLAIPAVTDANGALIIPAYQAVVADERVDVNVSIGGQWLFNTKNDRLFPYVGFALPFDYARRSQYDPTVTVDDQGNANIVDLGARHVDITAFGIQAVAGVDYYLAKDIFFGFDIKPISYSYAFSVKTPGPGLYDLEADTNTVSFFAQFSFKLGFKF